MEILYIGLYILDHWVIGVGIQSRRPGLVVLRVSLYRFSLNILYYLVVE